MEAVKTSFRHFDINGDGRITQDELLRVLQQINPGKWDEESVIDLVRNFDADEDGALNVDEFCDWIFGTESPLLDTDNFLEEAEKFAVSSPFVADLGKEDAKHVAVHGFKAIQAYFNKSLDKHFTSVASDLKSSDPGALYALMHEACKARLVWAYDQESDACQAYSFFVAANMATAARRGLARFRKSAADESLLGVSRYNDNYYCEVRSAEVVEGELLSITFQVVGDMSLGELQDPQSSRIMWDGGMARPTRYEFSRYDKQSCISGTLFFKFPGMGIAPSPQFVFGSGGYSTVDLIVSVGATPLLEFADAEDLAFTKATIGFSRYNEYYYCAVCRALWIATGQLAIDFVVMGDSSLGPLQDPAASTLSWSGARGCQPSSTEYHLHDEDKCISGTLIFEAPPLAEFVFTFGSSGYNSVQVKPLDMSIGQGNFQNPFSEIDVFGSLAEEYMINMMLPSGWELENMLDSGPFQAAFVGGDLVLRQDMGPNSEEFTWVETIMEQSFVKKYTRDRRGERVPEGVRLLRLVKVFNCANWKEYAERREIVSEAVQAQGLAWEDPLKTDGPDLPAAEATSGMDPYANEHWLWHGTSHGGALGITSGDFRISLAGSNAGTLYGNGIYLGEAITKSDEYCTADEDGVRPVLLCRAALGRVNYNDEVRPDTDALVDSCVNGDFHSVLGDREACRGTFKEIIIYDDNQVYPAYICYYVRRYN